MEDTWGGKHLCVLPEAEAQHWILGVRQFISFLDQELLPGPCKIDSSTSGLHRITTKYKQVILFLIVTPCVIL